MTAVGPARQTNWDWRAAGNFICGGTGSGLLVAAALAAPFGVTDRGLVLSALALIALGLFLVWLELGRRWRSFNVMFNPGTSWMSRESMAAAPLFAAGLAGAWLGWGVLVLAAAACALAFLYCQARVIGESKGIPAWREPLAVPLIVVTGVTEGGGLFLAAGGELEPFAAAALVVLVALRMWLWRSYRGRLAEGAPAATLDALERANLPVTLVGHMGPVILLAAALVMPAASGVLFPAAGLAALLGGWHLKFTIIVGAAFNQGFALPRSPERGGLEGPAAKPGW